MNYKNLHRYVRNAHSLSHDQARLFCLRKAVQFSVPYDTESATAGKDYCDRLEIAYKEAFWDYKDDPDFQAVLEMENSFNMVAFYDWEKEQERKQKELEEEEKRLAEKREKWREYHMNFVKAMA
jgi:hypothetical protein